METADQELNSKRRFYLNALLVTLMCLGVASIAFIGSFVYNYWYVFIAIQLTGFALAGVLYVQLEVKKKLSVPRLNYQAPLVRLVIMGLIILIAVGVIYWMENAQLVWLSLGVGAAFLLPSLTTFSEYAYSEIPDLEYPIWYKKDNLIDNKTFVFLTSVPIKIKLAPQAIDNTYTVYNSTVPAQMEIGNIFHYFLVKQQIKKLLIETEDEYGEPYGWQFYTESLKGYQHTPLHPNLNLWENQVKANGTIIARRVIGEKGNINVVEHSNKDYELHKH